MQKTQTPYHRVPAGSDLARYHYPKFSLEEYADRHRAVRQWMTELELDCLLVSGGGAIWDRCWSNISYLTNHMGTMELNNYCIFPLEGDPTVVCLTLNATPPDRAARSIISDVRGGTDYAAMAVDRIAELGLEQGRIGIVELDIRTSIPINHYQTFVQRLPDAKLRFVTKEWWLFRRAKRPAEIAEMEKAAAIGDKAIDALTKARPGMTEADLFSIVYESVYRNGADHPSMLLLASTSMHDPDSGFQRGRPVARTLAEGDIILTELGPRTPTGYESQVGRPLTLGKPTADYLELWKIAEEAYYAVAEQLRPGKTPDDVLNAGRFIMDRGYEFQSPLMHGMFGIPTDGPKSYMWGADDNSPFVPGQFHTVEIHVATPNRLKGIWVGSGFLVTDGSPRCLSQQPVEIKVLEP